jgi:hypothetical protein
MAQTYAQRLQTANGMEVVVALWLTISPYGLGLYLSNPLLLNSVIVGPLIAFFAILRIVLPIRYGGLSWINVGLGIWLILSPFLLGLSDMRSALWNSIGVGTLVILLALWSHSVSKLAAAGNTGV